MKDVKEKFRNIDIWSFDGKGDINNLLKFESIFKGAKDSVKTK